MIGAENTPGADSAPPGGEGAQSMKDAQRRRQAVVARLEKAGSPLSATALAAELGVSRQVIVGDVALLRAGGLSVTATPRGYVLQRPQKGATRTVACVHTAEQMGAELSTAVDAGAEVVDVIVEHPVYGQLTGALDLTCRAEVEEFLRRSEGAEPLSSLTAGVHLHTLRARSEAVLDRAVEALRAGGFLFTDE